MKKKSSINTRKLRIPAVSKAEQRDIEFILEQRAKSDKKISRSLIHYIDFRGNVYE